MRLAPLWVSRMQSEPENVYKRSRVTEAFKGAADPE